MKGSEIYFNSTGIVDRNWISQVFFQSVLMNLSHEIPVVV